MPHRPLILALGALLAGSLTAAHAVDHPAAPAPGTVRGHTWANPIDIDYRYNYEQMNKGISYRTGADPAVVRYKGAYYLFQTLADGYWRSTDLVHWQFVKPDRWPFDGAVAPATLVADGKLFLMESAFESRPLLYSTDPAHGKWKFWTRLLPPVPGAVSPANEYKIKPGQLPPGPWDPGLFQDDDGKVYVYWDSSNIHPLYGASMDFAFDKASQGEGKRLHFTSKPKALLRAHPRQHGWERFGRNHSNTAIAPYIEGSWMNKHDGTYYLQYAGPGTEYNVYATGVYTSKHPLGPFHYAPYNPIGYKPGGFMQGAGHGSTFTDAHGNVWNTGTSWIGLNWTFERRIDMFPAGFHKDGQMWVDTRFGDFPHTMPDHKLKPGESTFTGWMLLSYKKHASASSHMGGHTPADATDENPRTFWLAKNNHAGQTLTVDMGGPRTVRAVQVNYADYKSGRYGDAPDIVTQFKLEGSSDGKHWHMLADLSHSRRDHADAYVELAKPAHVRYMRYVHVHVGAKTLAIADLRIFGHKAGTDPSAPVLVGAKRLADTRDARISWKPVPGAVGYNVRWGLAKDRLHETWQRWADKPTQLTLSSLNKGVRYVVAVEAFNEHGVSKLSKVMVLKP
ncbi:family 43 glycosylhydrolase [Oleiagrimonas sp. C23AA]|uniref:family 43 glycosylhydrolase n=1 Tax=Oleiagrimonas sp. C23AA TaxID=2719047 RepID=UPI00141D7B15|nr:family 43 glycosylhydrolase [Oleiagrimonas sp. C23AA]NII11944.1 family 43 glycosylhydrolase [Oleiagrimonas sp. C23AA]